MDVLVAIHNRRSIREFMEDKPVEEEKLRKILEACRDAPSSNNSQPWEFIVVRNKGTLKEIAKEAPYGPFLAHVPMAVAIVTDPEVSPNWHVIDGAILTQNFALAAHALGLGTCWVGGMNRDKVKELLNVPKGMNLLTVLPLGYPAGKPAAKPRKALRGLIHHEKY
jgi:nitroreductase